jgi:predicted nucleotidyltransferase
MSVFDLIAADLGTSSRTLRRAASRGTIRCRRPSPNKPHVPAEELRYLRHHWPLLSELLGALRTQHDVRLAVLFGSFARGEEHARSDLDLLVSFAGEDGLASARLARRLGDVVGRRVQVVPLGAAEASPLLLGDALRDGRVLVDRDGDWERLRSREQAIRRAAKRQERELDRAAWETLERLGERA